MYTWVRVLGNFETHYKEHRLWLDDRIIDRLDYFLKECHRLYGRARRAVVDPYQPGEKVQVPEGTADTVHKNNEHISNQFPEAREELAQEFRKILFGR
jgi:hypothetical protein